MANLTYTIRVNRLRSDAPPRGQTFRIKVEKANVEISTNTKSESFNEQTTEAHIEETTHSRTRNDKITANKIVNCEGFKLDEDGKVSQTELQHILISKLHGAWKSALPPSLNGIDRTRLERSDKITCQLIEVGDVESEPYKQSNLSKAWTNEGAQIDKYFQVLSNLKAKVTFGSALLKPIKVKEYAEKALETRIGGSATIDPFLGTIDILEAPTIKGNAE